jgi:hypothetical protein
MLTPLVGALGTMDKIVERPSGSQLDDRLNLNTT